MRIFVDMDGTLTKWRSVKAEKELLEKDFFLKIPHQKEVVMAVKKLEKAFPNKVYILTKYLENSQYAFVEKHMALDNMGINAKRIFVPYQKSKLDYVGKLNNDDYLLDDYTFNLKEWEEAGGTGLKMINNANGLGGKWQGKRILPNDKCYENILAAIS